MILFIVVNCCIKNTFYIVQSFIMWKKLKCKCRYELFIIVLDLCVVIMKNTNHINMVCKKNVSTYSISA